MTDHKAEIDAILEKAKAEFSLYFVENYPGPSTVIADPHWHAPHIFRVVRRSFRPELEALFARIDALEANLEQAARLVETSAPYLEGVGSVGIPMAEHIRKMKDSSDTPMLSEETCKADERKTRI